MSVVAQRENCHVQDGVQVAERPGRVLPVPPRAAVPAVLEKPSAQAAASIPPSPISTFLTSPGLLSVIPAHPMGSKRASPPVDHPPPPSGELLIHPSIQEGWGEAHPGAQSSISQAAL